MLSAWLAHLDRIGTDDPDFNEGQPEDRCPICDCPVADHPCRGGTRAKWPHRRAVIVGFILGKLP